MDKLSKKVAELTRAEWRELGFYYITNDSSEKWELYGSKDGFANFVSILRNFSRREQEYGEHEHLLPHWYLTLTFEPSANITKRGISGKKDDFDKLASYLESLLECSTAGTLIKLHECFEAVCYSMHLHVQAELFDPAILDPQLQS